jgi:hypothetical protein
MGRGKKAPSVSIAISGDAAGHFFTLLQMGFFMEAPESCSVRDFLQGPCRLDGEYLSRMVQAVFLDGKPVDDIDAAVLTDNCVLALSGPLPGLVGAVMRRNSPYSSFRDSISYDGERTASGGKCLVRLKLFNLLIRDLGPVFLERGILVQVGDLRSLLDGAGRLVISLDGKRAGRHVLEKRLSKTDGTVLLRVSAK